MAPDMNNDNPPKLFGLHAEVGPLTPPLPCTCRIQILLCTHGFDCRDPQFQTAQS